MKRTFWCAAILVSSILLFVGSVSAEYKFPSAVAGLLGELESQGGEASVELIIRLEVSVNRNDPVLMKEFGSALQRLGDKFGQKGPAYQLKLFERIDDVQWKRLEPLLKEVAEEFGGGLDAIIRTGSSGQRHLTRKGLSPGVTEGTRPYHALLSDDDISFLGPEADKAIAKFEKLLDKHGFRQTKVHAFPLEQIADQTDYTLLIKQLKNPEAFVGASGFGAIKEEMVKKGGAVVFVKRDGQLTEVWETLADYIKNEGGANPLAKLFDLEQIAKEIRELGPLTMLGSVDRQLAGGALQSRETAKQLMRIHAMMDVTDGWREAAMLLGENSGTAMKEMREIGEALVQVAKGSMAADAFLAKYPLEILQKKYFEYALLSTSVKLNALVTRIEAEGGDVARALASNPEARKMIREMAAGFELFHQSGVFSRIGGQRITELLMKASPSNKNLFKVISTAKGERKVIENLMQSWVEVGGKAENATSAISNAANAEERKAVSKVAAAKFEDHKSGKALKQVEDILEHADGEPFIKGIFSKKAAARLFVLTVAAGAATLIKNQFDSWLAGGKVSITDTVWSLVDFTPVGYEIKNAWKITTPDEINKEDVFMVVKDLLYLHPIGLWIALTADGYIIFTELTGEVKLMTAEEGLVDLLVYNSEFKKENDDVRLEYLTLLDGEKIARDQLEAFFFNRTAVKVKISVISAPGWGIWINNVKEKAQLVLNEHYLKYDTALEADKRAVQEHLNAINRDQLSQDFWGGHLIWATGDFVTWLGGWESIVNASDANWAKVYKALKKQVDDRKEHVRTKIMVPHIIRAAEEKRATLDAKTDLDPKLEDIEKQLIGLRGGKALFEGKTYNDGSPMSLKTEVARRAEQKSKEKGWVSSPTREQSKMQGGEYWQAAYSAYAGMLKDAQTVRRSFAERTGFDSFSQPMFIWSGAYEQDRVRSKHSKAGYASDLSMILRDLKQIKGSVADLNDPTDNQAYGILCGAVLPWRAALDSTNNAVAASTLPDNYHPAHEKGSSFHTEYNKALDEVRKLYKKDSAFQKQLEEGAKIVKEEDLMLYKSIPVRLELIDASLKKDYKDARLSFKWFAEPAGTFSPDDNKPGSRFAPSSPGPIVVGIEVEKTGLKGEKVRGALKIEDLVKVPDNFLRLSVDAEAAKKGEAARADANIEERFIAGPVKFGYVWSCSSCRLDDKAAKGLSTVTVKGPESGEGMVKIDLQVYGKDGRAFTVASKSAAVPAKTKEQAEKEKTAKEKAEKEKADREKADKEKAEREKADKEKADKEKDLKKEPPVCSYEYSEWGECSRAAKKQTRSVIGKKPEGCVEKDKPALEQGCTPPPSEEDKRNSYLNCSCRCYSGWGGHIGVWYDPEEKTKPECKSSGPCIGGIGAWGCSRRHFFGAPNDCAKGCYEGVYGKGSYDEKDADKIRRDANRKFKEPLKLKFNFEKCPIHAQLGDVINFTVDIEGGVPSHTVTWSAEGDAKDRSFTFAKTRQPGTHTISATVNDSEDGVATTSCSVIVDAVTVKIEKTSPAENTLPIGSRASFKATVMSGAGQLGGELKFRWQPHPEVQFGDDKNPLFETTSPNTTATYTKIGTFPMSVNVLKKMGEVLTTVGESDQLPVEIVNPRLKLTVNKQTPMIGENVVITVYEEPKMSDHAISFWWEIKGDAVSPGPVPNIPNSRAYSFKPKNNKPVTVTVHAKAKDGGDDLGTESITVNPKSYEVSVSEPEYSGPPVQIWKCNTEFGGGHCGIVEVKDKFAVFRDIFMSAVVTPAPESPRYRWSVDPSGVCGLPGAGREIKINCSEAGTYTVSVVVTNADGSELGKGSGSVTISISQKDLDNSSKAKEAYEKLQKAKELVAQGKLDEGIALAEEAAHLDSKNSEASSLPAKWKKEKEAVLRHIEKMKKLAEEENIPEAEKELSGAKGLHPKYQPVIEAEKLLKDKLAATEKKNKDAAAGLAKAKELVSQGKLDEGIQQAEEASKLDPKNKEAVDFAKKWKNDKQTITQQLEKVKTLTGRGKLKDAEKELAVAKGLNAKYPPVLEAEKALKAKADETTTKAAKAKKLRDEGEAFQRRDKLEEAVAKYRESLTYVHDKALEEHIRTLETKIAATKKNQADANARWEEGRSLYTQNRINEALNKFRESLKLWSSPERVRYVQDLEAKATRNMAGAKRLRAEGEAFQQQNKLAEAIDKFRESLKYGPDPKLEEHIAVLEAKLKEDSEKEARKAQAKKLRDEGETLQKQGKLAEAVRKYKESLTYWPNPELERHIALVEAEMKKQEEAEAKKTCAKKNRDEGASLQKQGLLKEALAKYRASYDCQPTPDMAQHIKTVEAAIASQSAGTSDATASASSSSASSRYYHVDLTPFGGKKGTPRKARDIEVDDASWIRLKATHEKKLRLDVPLSSPERAVAIAIVSNLDNAHNVLNDVTTTTVTVHTTSGDRVFELKAGVHSSEWNRSETGGAEHRFPKETYMGDKRWMAVFPLPQGAVVTGLRFDHRDTDRKYYHGDAAPGFCLRGITLIKSGSYQDTSPTSSGNSNITGPTPPAKGKVIFENGNIGGVDNSPTRPAVFTIKSPHEITLISNYHWNNGRGARPGTIGLKHQNGKLYGPWRTKGTPGQGGVQNAGWECYPNAAIPAGTYTVIDSDPGTWSQNSGSQGSGFTRVEGYPVSESGAQTSGSSGSGSLSSGAPTGKTVSPVVAELRNTSNSPTHIFVDGQDNFGPQNKLAPGEKRKTPVNAPRQGGVIRFIAGRDGRRLAECRWEYDPDASGRVPVVTFSDPERLGCVTGLR